MTSLVRRSRLKSTSRYRRCAYCACSIPLPGSVGFPKPCDLTTGRNLQVSQCSNGPPSITSDCILSIPESRCKTDKSSRSTAVFETSYSTRIAIQICSLLEQQRTNGVHVRVGIDGIAGLRDRGRKPVALTDRHFTGPIDGADHLDVERDRTRYVDHRIV